MSVCAVQPLLDPCFYELSPILQEVVETQMLCNLKNALDTGEPVSCDIQALLTDAACFYNLSSQQLRVIRLQLLCDINNLV